MTREEAQKHLPIIKALADGKTIQFRDHLANIWQDIHNPAFAIGTSYRIKPEPLVFYVNEYSRDNGDIVLGSLHESLEAATRNRRLAPSTIERSHVMPSKKFVRTVKLVEELS